MFGKFSNKLSSEMNIEIDRMNKKNNEMFVQITLHDFDRVRKEIRREDKKFWTSRSMRKYLFSKFDDALYSRITDERTRTKIVNYYIDQEYSNQLNNVNLYITIVMSIVLVIGVLVYEQMNKKKTVFRLK